MGSTRSRISRAYVGAALAFVCACHQERPARASYHVDLRDAASGEATVTLRLDDPPRSVELASQLSDTLSGVSDLRLASEDGRSVPISLVPPAAGNKDGITRYRAGSEGDLDALIATYRVRVTPWWPHSGAQELRQNGVIGSGGAALSLPGLLLRPSCPLAAATFDCELPDGWQVVESPGTTVPADAAAFASTALVAGNWRVQRKALAPNLELTVSERTLPDGEALVAKLVAGLTRVLGEPAAPVHLVLAPWGPDDLPVELDGRIRTALVDLRAADPESLRNLVRALVPRWFSRTPAEIEGDASSESWFALGLIEYLALTLPAELGLVQREPASSIEWAWMRSNRKASLVTHVEDQVEHRVTRREMSTALIHELYRSLPGDALAAALRDYSGSGYPRFDSPEVAQRFAAFVDANLKDGVHLSFEDDWHIALQRRPATRPPSARVEKVLKIAFTSETEGYIEGCGCKLAQSGGIAHRAEALRVLRARDPQMLLLDLGNFSPVKSGHARLDALATEEYRFYLSAMRDMSYEAACVGPLDLYSGSSVLPQSGEAGTPFLGLGIEVAGEAPFAPHLVLKKNGMRIGVIGFTELLEPGLRYEAQDRNMAGVTFPRSVEALAADVKELRPEVDVLIVAGRMQPRTLRALCAPELGVDLVLLGGYDAYQYLDDGPSGFMNDTAVACHQIGGYGYSQLTLFLSGQGPVEVQVEPRFLKKDEPIHPDMQRRIDHFYQEIGNRHELLADMEPLFAWDTRQLGGFVGVDECRKCHVPQYEQWSRTPHAHAMETLVGVGRQNSPKCVQCHVLGFEKETGFRMAGTTPELADVQCEICHGAGAEHSRTQLAADIRRSPPARLCFECHDQEHAESFAERLEAALETVRH